MMFIKRFSLSISVVFVSLFTSVLGVAADADICSTKQGAQLRCCHEEGGCPNEEVGQRPGAAAEQANERDQLFKACMMLQMANSDGISQTQAFNNCYIYLNEK